MHHLMSQYQSSQQPAGMRKSGRMKSEPKWNDQSLIGKKRSKKYLGRPYRMRIAVTSQWLCGSVIMSPTRFPALILGRYHPNGE